MRTSVTKRVSVPGPGSETSPAMPANRPYSNLPSFPLEPALAGAIGAHSIRTAFQPIVELTSASVVGFEALTRGPENSAIESPLDLLGTAERHGLLGEIDWTCRAAAVRAALASGLPRTITWFVNVEPAALGSRCPTHLLALFRSAASRLRLVLEVVERGCEGREDEIMELAATARRNGWGIALDDIGANDASLALLPLVKPDIVKIDTSLLKPANRTDALVVAGALQVFSRTHRRPRVLAEGIETGEHLDLARDLFGARYGQGFRFGRPGPLPANMLTPAAPIDIPGCQAA